jgi:hypothetical protein
MFSGELSKLTSKGQSRFDHRSFFKQANNTPGPLISWVKVFSNTDSYFSQVVPEKNLCKYAATIAWILVGIG